MRPNTEQTSLETVYIKRAKAFGGHSPSLNLSTNMNTNITNNINTIITTFEINYKRIYMGNEKHISIHAIKNK